MATEARGNFSFTIISAVPILSGRPYPFSGLQSGRAVYHPNREPESMKKIALSLLMLLLPAIAFSQAQAPAQPEVAADGIPNYPVQSIRSYEFDVRAITVSRQYETRGRGEILNVEFGIHNNTDYPMDLYVFAIATYEDYKKERSPYNPLLRSTERTALLNFVPFPLAAEDANKDFRSMKLENFRYTVGTGDDKKRCWSNSRKIQGSVSIR
jgi:hypothetical protein